MQKEPSEVEAVEEILYKVPGLLVRSDQAEMVPSLVSAASGMSKLSPTDSLQRKAKKSVQKFAVGVIETAPPLPTASLKPQDVT